MIVKGKTMNRPGNTVRPVRRFKSHKGIPSSLVETPNRQWGALVHVWKRGGQRGVGGGKNEGNLYSFTREGVKEVTPRHDRSDRLGRLVRPVGRTGQTGQPLAAENYSPMNVSLRRICEEFKALKLYRYRPLFQDSKFFLILPRE